MSGSIESYDGLCGLIALFSSSDNRIRCKYEFGHSGDCSWKKYEKQFIISGGTVIDSDIGNIIK